MQNANAGDLAFLLRLGADCSTENAPADDADEGSSVHQSVLTG